MYDAFLTVILFKPDDRLGTSCNFCKGVSYTLPCHRRCKMDDPLAVQEGIDIAYKLGEFYLHNNYFMPWR